MTTVRFIQSCDLIRLICIGAGMGSGESTHVTPMCPGFDSQTWRQIWVEFIVGSRPCSEVFFRALQLSPLLKNQNKYPILSGHCPHIVKSISLSCHGIMCYTNLPVHFFFYNK